VQNAWVQKKDPMSLILNERKYNGKGNDTQKRVQSKKVRRKLR